MATAYRPPEAPCGRDQRGRAGDASASWRSRGWLERTGLTRGLISRQAEVSDERPGERDERRRLAGKALRQAEAGCRAIRRAIRLLVRRLGAARHICLHCRHFFAIHPDVASLRRRHQGSQHRGRDEQAQDQDVNEKPELHNVNSAMVAGFAKGRELRLFDRDQANRCFVISLLALQHPAQDVIAPIEMVPQRRGNMDQS